MDQNQDKSTKADFPTESSVSGMTGLPPDTTQDKIQSKDTHPVPGQGLKYHPDAAKYVLVCAARKKIFFIHFFFYFNP